MFRRSPPARGGHLGDVVVPGRLRHPGQLQCRYGRFARPGIDLLLALDASLLKLELLAFELGISLRLLFAPELFLLPRRSVLVTKEGRLENFLTVFDPRSSTCATTGHYTKKYAKCMKFWLACTALGAVRPLNP